VEDTNADFYAGVDAMLISKSGSPTWDPPTLKEVRVWLHGFADGKAFTVSARRNAHNSRPLRVCTSFCSEYIVFPQ
jgi:hypothetical protein